MSHPCTDGRCEHASDTGCKHALAGALANATEAGELLGKLEAKLRHHRVTVWPGTSFYIDSNGDLEIEIEEGRDAMVALISVSPSLPSVVRRFLDNMEGS